MDRGSLTGCSDITGAYMHIDGKTQVLTEDINMNTPRKSKLQSINDKKKNIKNYLKETKVIFKGMK